MVISNKFLRRLGYGLTITFFIIIVGGIIRHQTGNSADSKVARSYSVIYISEKLFATVLEGETNATQFLITGEPYFLATYKISKTAIRSNYDTLLKLCSDNLVLRLRLNYMYGIILSRLKYSDSVISLKSNSIIPSEANLLTIDPGTPFIRQIRQFSHEVGAAENKVLQQKIKASKRENIVFNIVIICGVASVLFLLILLISEQKKFSEIELKIKSETIFRALLEAAPDAMVIINKKRKIVLVNRETEKMFGYSKEYLFNKPADILVFINEVSNTNEFKKESRNRLPFWLNPGVHEMKAVRKNGEEFSVEINISPIQTDEGLLVFASIRDINTRLKLAAALRVIEKNYELVIKSVKDYAILSLDKEGIISSWNIGAEYINGYKASEIIGKSMDVFYTPEELLNNEPKKNLALTLKYGHYHTEGLRVKKDGSTFYAGIDFTSIYDENNELYGYAKVTKDITQLRNKEERIRFLATIANNIQDPVISTDKNFCITTWSHAAEKLFEFTSEEVIGKTITQALNVKYLNESREEILEILQTKDIWQGEINYETKFGKIINALPTVSLLKDGDGKFIGNLLLIRNISKEKKTQAALNQLNAALEEKVIERTKDVYKNEKLFRALIENNYDVISLVDKDFKIIYLSPSAFRITGYTNEERKNVDGFQNIHPDDIADVKKKFLQIINKPNLMITLLFRNKHKNGNYVWLEGRMHNLLTDENVKAIVFNSHDVTDKIQSIEALASSEIRFRSLIENSSEGITLTDKFNKVIYRSPASQKLIGVGMDDDKNFISQIHPDDVETINYIHAKSLRIPGVPLPFEAQFLNAAGKFMWMEGTFNNLLDLQGINAVVANYRGIEQRKDAEGRLITSEKLYRFLFENMLHGFSYCKGIFKNMILQDFTYIAVNSKYETLMGKTGIMGKNVSEVMPGLFESDGYAALITDVLKTGEPIKFETYVNLWHKWVSISIYSPGENYFVTLIDEITERKESEIKIKQLNIELEQKVLKRTEELKKINLELEAFSYSVSHDLRAPLRGIIGFTTILYDDYKDKLDEEAKRLINIIKNNTIKMGKLIDGLLSFSRLSRQEIAKTQINSQKLVGEIIADLPLNNNVSIKWQHVHLPRVNGDITTLRQVWINLLSNAIKYSGSQEFPVIEIGCSETPSDYTFYVKDNGVGFDIKYKDKLFKVFQRLHTEKEFEGTGVGLAIVEKIVSKHGGKIWAESELGKGACFYFSLPK